MSSSYNRGTGKAYYQASMSGEASGTKNVSFNWAVQNCVSDWTEDTKQILRGMATGWIPIRGAVNCNSGIPAYIWSKSYNSPLSSGGYAGNTIGGTIPADALYVNMSDGEISAILLQYRTFTGTISRAEDKQLN